LSYHVVVTKVPIFQTPRLILRELVETDAPAYEKYFIDYKVIRSLAAAVPWPYPKGAALDFIKTQILPKQGNDKWVWAITLREDSSELIGVIDLWRECTPANRGFWLGQKFWGKGYMTEAVKPVMDYAFDHLGFEKLVFSNAVGNRRSARVKEKTGARLIERSLAKFVDPELTEREVYELTKDEWKSFRSRHDR
jgi:[ribosomal protein S5]-alanine N-acetyltransferase